MPSSRPTTAQTPNGHPTASPGPMLVEGFQCILGTGGMEPALASEKRSQGCLVGKYPKPQTPNANPTTHDRRPSNACRASCKSLAYSVINMGWCERTFTTTSTPSGHSCCCKRKASRRHRRIRLRTTALPILLGRLRPSLGPVSREVWRANTNRGPTRRERLLAYTESNPARFRRRC